MAMVKARDKETIYKWLEEAFKIKAPGRAWDVAIYMSKLEKRIEELESFMAESKIEKG